MKKSVLIVFTVLICSAATGQTSVELKFNPEKNKVYRMRTMSEQTIVQTVNGNQQTIDSKVNYTASLKAMDATSSFVVAEVRLDTISTFSNTMGRVTNISSALQGNPASEENSEVLSYFMNKLSKSPLYMKIDYSGKILEVVNGKMTSDMILKDTSLITITGPVGQALKAQVASLVGDNAIKNIIEMFTVSLPGKTVSKGETWKSITTTNAGGMSLDIESSYKLDDLKGNSASISSESAIKAAPNALPMQQGGATITYDDLKGMSKSEMLIDTRTGLVVESTSKSHISGNLGVSVQGMNLQVPMDISSTSRTVTIQ